MGWTSKSRTWRGDGPGGGSPAAQKDKNQNRSDVCKEMKVFLRGKKLPYSLRSMADAGIGGQLCSLGRDISYTHSVEWHPEVRGPHGRASPSYRIKEELTPFGMPGSCLPPLGGLCPPKDIFLPLGDSTLDPPDVSLQEL